MGKLKHFSGIAYMALLLIVIPLQLKAQVPGYQGKRFLLSYNAQMAPNIYVWAGQQMPFRLYTKHSVEAEYVIGRQIILGLDASYMNHSVPVKYNYFDGNPNSTLQERIQNVSISGYGFGGNLKFYGLFTKNTLAPLGSYLSLHGQVLSYNLTDEIGVTQATNELTDKDFKKITSVNNGVMAGMGFGTRRIYFNRVTLDMGLSTNVALVLPNNFLDETADTYSYLMKFAFNRNLLMYKIGIGGLLF